MLFAQMVVSDEDAIICDFLQYYQVMDYKSLSVHRAAVLACGLPPDSRSMKKLSGRPCSVTELYLLSLIDVTRAFQYAYTKVHSKGHVQPPESLVEKIMPHEKESEIESFDSPEAFERTMKEIENR